MFGEKSMRIDKLEKEVWRLRVAAHDEYMNGVLDAFALVENGDLDSAREIMNRSRSWTTHADGSTTEHPAGLHDQVANVRGGAVMARTQLEQRAADEALAERLVPLLKGRLK